MTSRPDVCRKFRKTPLQIIGEARKAKENRRASSEIQNKIIFVPFFVFWYFVWLLPFHFMSLHLIYNFHNSHTFRCSISFLFNFRLVFFFFFFLRQSESCFPCYLLLPLSFVYSLRIPFPVLFVCPYVLCFKTKLKVREGRHLVRSSFRNYFCIQAYFWRFFVIYICLFFDMPDREISGQYASIPQSLRGRQGGMVIPQSSQDINRLIGLMDRAITRSFRCKSIKSNRFDRNH